MRPNAVWLAAVLLTASVLFQANATENSTNETTTEDPPSVNLTTLPTPNVTDTPADPTTVESTTTTTESTTTTTTTTTQATTTAGCDMFKPNVFAILNIGIAAVVALKCM